ncbi:hypothetical protein MOK15_09155 [Sphingobium sp. BYY-5]|uniref:hypothetical protein n=1 Tax=Sphingobium sp. BYY-5 TaxID=2926400 RepID=UPI001FA7F696|nr:hypothetical protein [Sphingobium sp. BYY-5]MCI4590263.1 hypothetical protein [Sphingobium sp. BYY-5]
MSYLVQDLSGLVLATLIAPLLLYLPGLGLVRLLAPMGLAVDSYWQRLGWAMVLGLAVLPVFDTLAIRLLGLPGMILLNGALAIWGAPLLKAMPKGASLRPFLLLAILWWLISAWSLVDFDIGSRLHQSLIVLDMVKHAAVIEQIARQGIPFTDPFFAREGIAGYYHYFYVWPAAIRWISGFHIMPAMAFGATAFWTGFGVIALLWRIGADAGFIRPGKERRVLLLAILLCFVAGADLLFMLVRYLIAHRIEPELDSWNTEIRMLGTSTLWVPHHVMALVAAWTGMLLCTRAQQVAGAKRYGLAFAAGAAFATMFGASIWISLTIMPLLAIWGFIALTQRDPILLVSGIAALCMSLPQIHDLLTGREPDIFPIGFHVRAFTILFAANTITAQLWSLILLPLNYALEFGIFALGTSLYFRSRRNMCVDGRTVRQLLIWSAITALVIASFLQSVIINNDLGWRAVLFILVPLMLWTMAVGQDIGSFRQLGAMGSALLLLGAAGTLWDLVGLRIIRPSFFPTLPIQINSDRQLSYALRTAYGWADHHLPAGAVLQHNPALTFRSIEFGLYGHHWPAVADKEAFLFGASRQAVAERMMILKPIFDHSISKGELLERAHRARSDYLLFTRRDRVWRAIGGPPLSLTCVYRTPDLCIAPARKSLHL